MPGGKKSIRRCANISVASLALTHNKVWAQLSRLRLLLVIAVIYTGCDRMVTPRHAQQLKDAETKAASGDFTRAISLYESALEDRPTDAEVHYKLALLYEDKMNDSLDALHHFKRYLAIAPSGARANDVKEFVKRDEVALLTSLSGDAIISRTEATRLRNENLSLRKELDEARGRGRIVTSGQAATATKTQNPETSKQTYIVQHGDTLASISRKFYKTSTRWKQILDANRAVINDPKKLAAGQTFVIPKR